MSRIRASIPSSRRIPMRIRAMAQGGMARLAPLLDLLGVVVIQTAVVGKINDMLFDLF